MLYSFGVLNLVVPNKVSPTFASKEHSAISYRNFKNFNRGSFPNAVAQQDWTYNGSDDSFCTPPLRSLVIKELRLGGIIKHRSYFKLAEPNSFTAFFRL